MNLTKLERMLSKRVRAQEFSGAVLISRGKTDVFRRAYGFADRTWKIRNTSETRFRIASVSKMFTTMAVMQLIEAGKFSLETRVVKYLKLKDTKLSKQRLTATANKEPSNTLYNPVMTDMKERYLGHGMVMQRICTHEQKRIEQEAVGRDY